jgi:hypothetical protein
LVFTLNTELEYLYITIKLQFKETT